MKLWFMVFGAMAGVVLPVQAQQVSLQAATATYSQASLPVGSAIDGSLSSGINGWAIYNTSTSSVSSQTAVFQTVTNLTLSPGEGLRFTLHQLYNEAGHTIGKFRLSVTSDNRTTYADGLSTGGNVTANWTVLNPSSAVSTNGATLGIQGDSSILASGTSPSTDVYNIIAETSHTNITGFRLEVMQDSSLPSNGPGRMSNGNFVLTEFQVFVTPVPEPTGIVLIAGTAALVYRRIRKTITPIAETGDATTSGV